MNRKERGKEEKGSEEKERQDSEEKRRKGIKREVKRKCKIAYNKYRKRIEVRGNGELKTKSRMIIKRKGRKNKKKEKIGRRAGKEGKMKRKDEMEGYIPGVPKKITTNVSLSTEQKGFAQLSNIALI